MGCIWRYCTCCVWYLLFRAVSGEFALGYGPCLPPHNSAMCHHMVVKLGMLMFCRTAGGGWRHWEHCAAELSPAWHSSNEIQCAEPVSRRTNSTSCSALSLQCHSVLHSHHSAGESLIMDLHEPPPNTHTTRHAAAAAPRNQPSYMAALAQATLPPDARARMWPHAYGRRKAMACPAPQAAELRLLPTV